MYSSKVSPKHNTGVSYKSQQAANEQALEMDQNGCVGCTDCVNCFNCIKCDSCIECTGCVNSTKLFSCNQCVDSSDLSSMSHQFGLFGAPSGG